MKREVFERNMTKSKLYLHTQKDIFLYTFSFLLTQTILCFI